MNSFDEIPMKMAENAAFFWLLHEQAIHSPDYELKNILELEERIDAQLEGLLLYGEAGWKACEAALQFEDAGEVFTAAVLAFKSGNHKWIKMAVETGCLNQRTYQALLTAIVWLPLETVKNWIIKFMQAENPAYLCLGICACALHGKQCGEILNAALNNQQIKKAPGYFSYLIHAAGVMQRKELLTEIIPHLQDENPQIAFSSIRAALLLGDKSKASLLKSLIFEKTELSESALNLAFRVLPKKDAQAWAKELGKNPEHLRKLIIALGIMGDCATLPWLIKQMSENRYSQLAGYSFSMITGLDLKINNMTKTPTLIEIDERDELDRKLPWPDEIKISQWYEKNSQNFEPEQRYLAGEIINQENLYQILRQGKQTQRVAARLELQLNYGIAMTGEAPKRLRM